MLRAFATTLATTAHPPWEAFTPNMDVFGHLWGKTFAEIDSTEGIENFNRLVLLTLGRYDLIVELPAIRRM